MQIQVLAIQFSRINNGPGAQALRLRKNALELSPFPEWQRGLTILPGDCSVAYAMEDVALSPAPVVILAKFVITGWSGSPAVLKIRAIEPEPPFMGFPLPQVITTQLNILGEVGEGQVMVAQNGETQWLPFELKNTRFTQWGVGIYQSVWKWQWFIDALGVWSDFEITYHQVYNLLRQPTAPWSQQSVGDLQLPWTDVLDYACTWAAKSFSPEEAAANITRRVFSMGPLWFEYNCVSFLPAYVQVIGYSGQTYFNCMELLQHLRTRNVNRFIICSDCAAIVSTFANILGCDLWQSTMQTPGTTFRTNRILAIGSFNWGRPCGLQGFSYHEIAWAGNGLATDPVYDACVAIDGTDNTQDQFSVPVLPVNMFLGARGSGLYRDKLVFPPDWNLAEPQPITRERRLPFPSFTTIRFALHAPAAAAQPADENVTLARVKRRLDFGGWKNRNLLPQNLLLHGFSLDPASFSEWNIQVVEELERSHSGPRYLHAIWRSRRYLGEAVRVDLYECPSRLRAHEFLLRLLSNVHTTIDAMKILSGVGDVAFTTKGNRHVIFARANVVIAVSKAGMSDIPVVQLARRTDKILYAKPDSVVSGDSGNSVRAAVRQPAQSGRIPVATLYEAGASPASQFLKIFSNTKDLSIEDGHLLYNKIENETPDIQIYSFEK